MSADIHHLKCLHCDTPCLILELIGCDVADCPHVTTRVPTRWRAEEVSDER